MGETGDEAALRCSFQLSYSRAKARRHFTASGITGEWIADATKARGLSSGEWMHDFPEFNEERDDWPLQFFRAAIAEAVHEACEWFQVESRSPVYPHRSYYFIERSIELATELADRLWKEADKVATDDR